MSLVPCPSCSNNVSQTAMKCPSCGHQLKKPKRTFFGKLIKWIFILFNLFMIYALVKGMGGAGQVINEATSEAAQQVPRLAQGLAQ